MKLYYLAHPVRPDGTHSEKGNLQMARLFQRVINDAGVMVVNPWYTLILNYPDRDTKHIETFLQLDCEVVARFDGVILCGHTLSSGMTRERDTAIDQGLEVINLVGYTPAGVRRYFLELRKAHELHSVVSP